MRLVRLGVGVLLAATLVTGCSATPDTEPASPTTGASSRATKPSATPTETPAADSAGGTAGEHVLWFATACEALTAHHGMEWLEPDAVTKANREEYGRIAGEAASLLGAQDDLIGGLPEGPSREARIYVRDFRKNLRTAQAFWQETADTAAAPNATLKDVRKVSQLANFMSNVSLIPPRPDPGPLREAFDINEGCIGIPLG